MAHQIRRILKKSGINVIHLSGSSLQNVICGKNKVKLPPRQIIYKARCRCKQNKNNAYIGQSRRTVNSRLDEHKGYIRRGEWTKSGLAAHKETCKEEINWEEDVEIIAKINSRSKRQASMKLDYMESLCIKLHRTGPGHGFNEDEGRRIYTKQWDPVLNELRKRENLV